MSMIEIPTSTRSDFETRKLSLGFDFSFVGT